MGAEDSIEDNKAPCEGCPVADKCEATCRAGSKTCKELIKAYKGVQ